MREIKFSCPFCKQHLVLVFVLSGYLSYYCGAWLAERMGEGEFTAQLLHLGILFVNFVIIAGGCSLVMQ